MELITALHPPDSPARAAGPDAASASRRFRIGAVQMRFDPDPASHEQALTAGVQLAADAGAQLVCLPELTLSSYFAVSDSGPGDGTARPEVLVGGRTHRFAAACAAATGVFVHASLYEAPDETEARGPVLGFNTAICVAPDGALVARTRKMHIPITAGYYEDRWFRPGDSGFPVVEISGLYAGFPTCWDQWFPELARAYSLAGAEVLVYPTAIGSEPDHPEFDTEPLWEQVIRANGITNGTFMVAVNRTGTEGPLTFYGTSFVSDPYGRVLVRAPRDDAAVLVAELDLDQRRDWLALFPFLTTRRPDQYEPLTRPNP
ncbi:MAG: nitrilase-related carbon-nitrogen hydrolase [Acidimicrobiia bacterium]